MALGVFTALLPVLPKPWGILFFLVSLILRAIYTMGLGPALLLLGTINVNDAKLDRGRFHFQATPIPPPCFSFLDLFPNSCVLLAFQQVSLPCEFRGQPGDVHSGLQGSCDGHALHLPPGLRLHLCPGPLCARVLLQLSGKKSSACLTFVLRLQADHESVSSDWPVSISPQLFDLVIREETLLNVIKSVTRNGRSIILTAVLAIFLVYFFSIIGFLFLKDDFRMEVDRLPAPGQCRRETLIIVCPG